MTETEESERLLPGGRRAQWDVGSEHRMGVSPAWGQEQENRRAGAHMVPHPLAESPCECPGNLRLGSMLGRGRQGGVLLCVHRPASESAPSLSCIPVRTHRARSSLRGLNTDRRQGSDPVAGEWQCGTWTQVLVLFLTLWMSFDDSLGQAEMSPGCTGAAGPGVGRRLFCVRIFRRRAGLWFSKYSPSLFSEWTESQRPPCVD